MTNVVENRLGVSTIFACVESDEDIKIDVISNV